MTPKHATHAVQTKQNIMKWVSHAYI
jgi:hypothetical protein